MRFIHRRHRHERTVPARHPLAAASFAAMIAIALLAGCNADEATTPAAGEALPSWLVSVDPEPNEQSAVLRRIEVNYKLQTDGENVRLSVDGTDVTSYADFGREQNVGGPSSLVYDFEQARELVSLEPGEHTATVDLVRLEDLGEQPQILDTYSWSFTIQ
ncbi:hypothetical protein BH23ACT12_BH23ACT12_03150 [soil metagenome]